MDDSDWLRLCVYEEARGEVSDGRAAVALVVLNRVAAHYSASGSIASAVTWPSQFSWCEFDMVAGRYQRVCAGQTAIRARAQQLIAAAQRQYPQVWASCAAVADAVRMGSYTGGPGYRALTPDTVLYANLAICSPAWALKVPRVATIGHQAFYRDPRAHVGTPVDAIHPHQLLASPASADDALINGTPL